MDKNSSLYTFSFAAIVTLIVAVVLTFVSVSLTPRKDANELTYKKRDILSGVMDSKPLSNDEVIAAFEEKIQQVLVDVEGNVIEDSEVPAIDIDLKKEKKRSPEEMRLPLFVASSGGTTNYIVPVRGSGLWDEIWGFIALKDDFNEIIGVSFDHAGETPGLGAEIKDNANWKGQFIGKKLFNADGEFISVDVVKGGVKVPDHQVDAISGATITGDGVADMMNADIDRYVAYINAIKN
ncbi:MAG: NADH:ubiquinone reductase (Na(+)-transporting) subunit C [Bacteroidetes bacterium]|nr:NADH:ubiquinone reductase (Na(+)-transporting) subunit C [Bacteroidota bacterium]